MELKQLPKRSHFGSSYFSLYNLVKLSVFFHVPWASRNMFKLSVFNHPDLECLKILLT